MKKISGKENEFDLLELKGAGNSSKFYKAIMSLHVGEILIISKKEYTL